MCPDIFTDKGIIHVEEAFIGGNGNHLYIKEADNSKQQTLLDPTLEITKITATPGEKPEALRQGEEPIQSHTFEPGSSLTIHQL